MKHRQSGDIMKKFAWSLAAAAILLSTTVSAQVPFTQIAGAGMPGGQDAPNKPSRCRIRE